MWKIVYAHLARPDRTVRRLCRGNQFSRLLYSSTRWWFARSAWMVQDLDMWHVCSCAAVGGWNLAAIGAPAVFQCILGDGRFESSTVAVVPSTRAGLNRTPQIHFKLTHSQHVRVVVVMARALANWAMIYPTSQTLGEFCLGSARAPQIYLIWCFLLWDVTDMYDDISLRYLMISQSCPSSYVG